MSCNFIFPGGYFWPNLRVDVPQPTLLNVSLLEPKQPSVRQMPESFPLPRFSGSLSGQFPIINYDSPQFTLPTLSDIIFPIYKRIFVPSVQFDVPEDINVSIPEFSIGSFRVDFLRPLYVVLPADIKFSYFTEKIPDMLSEIDFTGFVPSISENEFPVFRNVLNEIGIPVGFLPFDFSGDIFDKVGTRIGYLDMKFRRVFELVGNYLRSMRNSLEFRQIGERLVNYLSVEKLRLIGYESKARVWLTLLKMYQKSYFENIGAYLKKLDAFIKTEGARFTSYIKNVASELEGWRANVEMREIVNKINLRANSQNLEIIKNILILDGVYRELLNEFLTIYNAFFEIDMLRSQMSLLLLKREVAYKETEIVLNEESILDEEKVLLQEEKSLLDMEYSMLEKRYNLLLQIINNRLESLRAKVETAQVKFGRAMVEGEIANINAESQELLLKLEAKETYYSFLYRILERYFSLAKEVYSVVKGVDLTNSRLHLMYRELSRELNRLLAWYDIYLRGILTEMYSDEANERTIAAMLSQAQITSRIIESEV